ncbi:MAG: FAD-binding protein [Clostridia bacterium]|nr:FAD-binding protein [Clostridia bacterium]
MPFSRVNGADLRAWAALLGERGVLTEGEILQDYARDEMTEYGAFAPEAVLLPGSAEQVCAILAHCHRRGIPVTARGAGTGLCGGCVPVRGGVVLSLERMNRLLEIDERNMIATVEPGLLLMEFAQRLAGTGLFYPPDPGEKSATLGGNVATNAGGMRAVRYGVTRDYVLGLKVALADGRMLTLGGKVAKNASGYSLLDLMIGSEGTLGVVCEIVLRLIPEPAANLSLLSPFDSLDRCIEAVPATLASGAELTAVEFMERAAIQAAETYLGKQFPDVSAPAYLLLRLDGPSREALEPSARLLTDLLLELGAKDVLLADTDERKAGIWEARGAFLEAIKAGARSMDECDVVVPRERIPAFIRGAMEAGEGIGVRICSFGHAGDGNLHLYACQDGLSPGEWAARRRRVMDRMYALATAQGGQVSGEHGVGHAKADYLLQSLGEAQIELMRGIKRVFDPKGILNPGKVIG